MKPPSPTINADEKRFERREQSSTLKSCGFSIFIGLLVRLQQVPTIELVCAVSHHEQQGRD